MATLSTGKGGASALVANVSKKTVSITGDGTETESLENMRGDFATQMLGVEEFEELKINLGEHFYFTDTQTIAAASSDAVDYLIVAPDTSKWAHMKIDADGSLITSFALYEDVSNESSDGWTAETTYNNNRNSSADATLLIYSKEGSSDASTDYGTGVPIWAYSGGIATEMSKMPTINKLILGQGVKYVFRVISGSAANLCNLLFSWSEHTNES
jgi:hypothetical protein